MVVPAKAITCFSLRCTFLSRCEAQTQTSNLLSIHNVAHQPSISDTVRAPNTTTAMATSAPNSLSAASTVLSIAEILETIIINLPERDILVAANRVSREWHDAIKSSLRIRQRIFLPGPNVTALEPDFFARETNDDQRTPAYSIMVRSNPLLPFKHHDGGPKDPDPDTDCCTYEGQVYYQGYVHFMYEDLLWVEQPSKAAMYLTDPPFTKMLCWGIGHSLGFYHRGECILYNPSGLTYGDVIKTFDKYHHGLDELPSAEDMYVAIAWSQAGFTEIPEGATEVELKKVWNN